MCGRQETGSVDRVMERLADGPGRPGCCGGRRPERQSGSVDRVMERQAPVGPAAAAAGRWDGAGACSGGLVGTATSEAEGGAADRGEASAECLSLSCWAGLMRSGGPVEFDSADQAGSCGAGSRWWVEVHPG